MKNDCCYFSSGRRTGGWRRDMPTLCPAGSNSPLASSRWSRSPWASCVPSRATCRRGWSARATRRSSWCWPSASWRSSCGPRGDTGPSTGTKKRDDLLTGDRLNARDFCRGVTTQPWLGTVLYGADEEELHHTDKRLDRLQELGREYVSGCGRTYRPQAWQPRDREDRRLYCWHHT